MKRVLTIFLLVVSAFTLFGFSNQLKADELPLLYETGFETANVKSSYATGEMKDGSVTWILSESLRGNDGNDKRTDSWAIRGRADGYAKIDTTFENVFMIEFKYAHYGTLSQGNLKLQVSSDNGITWFDLWTMPEGIHSELTKVEVVINYESLNGISFSDELNFQWLFLGPKGNNSRMNIDDVKIYTGNFDSSIKATINQLIDEDNQISTQISGEYGQDIQIPVANEVAGSEFKFALVNGVIRNDFVVGNNTIPMTENLEVALVYSKEDKHAVLFIDSNGKLIDNLWVANGDDAVSPNVSELSKPGYVVSSTPWLSNEGETSLTGIDSSRVYQLQYELTKPTVTITVNDVEFEYEYNQVVTLESTNEDFTSWVDEDGIVLSTNKTFKFTALVDREIKESTAIVTELPVVTMTKDLKLRPSADQLQTFVGQIELRDGDVLVEHGLLLTKDGFLRDTELTVSNATKARSNVLVPGTNEFMLSVNEEYLVVRAYVIVRNSAGELETFYSKIQYDDVAIVTFDTDGGTIIEQVAIKKGTKVNEPVEPIKSANQFVGWFVDDEEFSFELPIIKDITIIALWELVSEPITTTASYTGSTTNMGTGNNASLINLDSNLFTVISNKNGNQNNVGLNKDGEIRLYASSGNGNELLIRIDNNYVITKVVFNFGKTVSNSLIKVGEDIKHNGSISSNSILEFGDLNSNDFSIKNIGTSQLYILSIEITYQAK